MKVVFNHFTGSRVIQALLALGNNLADAIVPLDFPDAPTRNTSWIHVESIILLHLTCSCEADWSSYVARSPITLFFRQPSDARIFHDFPLPCYLSRILSGHSSSFVHRTKPLIPSLCSCG